MPIAPVADNFYTTIRNVSGKTLMFGFLPPHGKTLTNGQEYTFVGDIQSHLDNPRKVKAFKAAIETGKIVVLTGASQSQVVLAAVDNTTVIAKGDLLWLDTDDVKPASDFVWNTDLATTQAGFSDKFLGVALAAHANGGGAVTNFPVDISPDSVWIYTRASGTHELGSPVGPAKQSGNALENQKLAVCVASSSIGRVVKRETAATTSIRVRLNSAYSTPQDVQGAQGAQGYQGYQGA